MDNVELYRDENLIVEIDGNFDKFVKTLIPRTEKLTEEQYNFLIDSAFNQLKMEGWNLKFFADSIFVSSSVPISEKYKKIYLVEPFNIFEDVLDVFSIIDDFSNKEEIKINIEDYFKEKRVRFFIDFYTNSIFCVDGMMAAEVDRKLLILFFKIDENNRTFT